MKLQKKSFFDNDILLNFFNNGQRSVIELYPNGYLIKMIPGKKETYKEFFFEEVEKVVIDENNSTIEIITKNENFIGVNSTRHIDYIKSFFKSNTVEVIEKSIANILKEKSKEVTYGVPAIASLFVPGLGQFLKKHFAKGVVFFICAAVLAITPYWMAIPVVYIVSVYDAYNGQKDF